MKAENNSDEFDRKIEGLDTSLFAAIDSQTTDDDRRSLLAVQLAVRRTYPSYCYLEIGSHLGGTIQPHLLDRKCTKIYSIDLRPLVTPDTRGENQMYFDNSTERMIELLKAIAPDELPKLETFERAAWDVPTDSVIAKPDICFLDGEHTDTAVRSDFVFCSSVANNGCTFVFHDSNLVHAGIRSIIKDLKLSDQRFEAIKLAGSVFVIAFEGSPVLSDPNIISLRQNSQLYFFISSIRLRIRRYRLKRKARRRANLSN